MTKKKLPGILALLAGIACIYLFLRSADMDATIRGLRQIGPRFIFLLLVTLLAYYFGTLNWKYCFRKGRGELPVGSLFVVRHVGEMVTLINPASIAGGEAVKALLLKKYEPDGAAVAASILASRAIMILTQVLVFAVTALSLLAFGAIDRPQLSLPRIPAYAWTLAPFAIAVFVLLFRHFAGPKIRSVATGLKQELGILLKSHRRMLLYSCLFAILHWFCGSLEFFFILKFLGVKVGLAQALLVDMGVIFFKTAGAFIPGQLGVEEYGNKVLLALVGVTAPGIWLAASVLRRSRQLVWLLAGLIMFLFIRKTLLRSETNGNTLRHA